MTPSADESVKFLTDKLKNREPFVFTKFGDGDLYWMADNPVPIAGGETFRPGIGQELRDAARSLAALPHVYFGDQLTCASGPYLPDEQLAFIRYRSPAGSPLKPIDSSRWLHFGVCRRSPGRRRHAHAGRRVVYQRQSHGCA